MKLLSWSLDSNLTDHIETFERVNMLLDTLKISDYDLICLQDVPVKCNEKITRVLKDKFVTKLLNEFREVNVANFIIISKEFLQRNNLEYVYGYTRFAFGKQNKGYTHVTFNQSLQPNTSGKTPDAYTRNGFVLINAKFDDGDGTYGTKARQYEQIIKDCTKCNIPVLLAVDSGLKSFETDFFKNSTWKDVWVEYGTNAQQYTVDYSRNAYVDNLIMDRPDRIVISEDITSGELKIIRPLQNISRHYGLEFSFV